MRPGAKKEMVEKVQKGFDFDKIKKSELDSYKVWVKEPAVEGRASQAVIQALAKHLNISAARIKIITGRTSRQKILEII